MILDRYTDSRRRMIHRDVYKVTKRYTDILLAATLCVAYDAFHRMMLHRTVSEADSTYDEAEKAAGVFSGIMGVDVPVTAFLPDSQSYDKAIECFKDYRKQKDSMPLFGYDPEDLEAFCRQVEYGAWKIGLMSFFALNSVGYMYNMVAVVSYVNGDIDARQLEKNMVKFSPPKLVPMTGRDIRHFIRVMIKTVGAFKEIAAKRTIRKQKHKKC